MKLRLGIALAALVVVATAGLGAPIVYFGTLASFGGPGELDLTGTFSCSWNPAGPTTPVGGLTFVNDAGATYQGITYWSQNTTYPWGTKPEYGSTQDANNLETVMYGIRWSASPNSVNVTLPTYAGRQHKLQLIFSENYWAAPGRRTFDINVGGSLAVDEFDTLAVTGGWSGQPTRGAVYTYSFVPAAGTVAISLTPGTTASDKNPILNALTLEVTIPTSPGGYSARVLSASPHIYLRLDEDPGVTRALDFAVQDGIQPGTYSNSPTLGVAGIPGTVADPDTAARFNGTNQSVLILDAPDPTAYTLEAWAMLESTANQSLIVRTDGAGPAANWSHQLRVNSGTFEHYLHDGAVRSVLGTTVVQPGVWYYVVGTATNGGQMNLYVNGQSEGTPVSIGNLWTGGDRWMLGSNSGQSMGYFLGTLDEVAIYSSVLSQSEIAEHYRLGSSLVPEPATFGLVALGALAVARRRRRRRAA
ncbi:MAG TPA: LamG-like jellyroll fold domain-containing protein [Planctomycetota bacterium]|nr:LamG-like jellyroll fold domain-containing protein [Planctomycetota bacterium]